MEFVLVAVLLRAHVYRGLRGRDESDPQHSMQSGVPGFGRMYIHGGDFSTYPMQQEAQRLAQGLNLQIGASFAGNEQSNVGNSGNGLVTVTQIMWIGMRRPPAAWRWEPPTAPTKTASSSRSRSNSATGRWPTPTPLPWGNARGHHEQLRNRAELHHGFARGAGRRRADQHANPVARATGPTPRR